MIFVIKVKNYKISSKFVKSAREKVYSIGFPASEVLNGNLSFESISEKIGAKNLEVVRLLLRICKDLKVIGIKRFVTLNIQVEELSKQLSSWQKYTAGVQTNE